MASITWQEIIDRARTYVDDDHNEESGWIADDRWLQLAFVEYQQLRKRWIRSGLMSPAITQSYITSSAGTSFSGVLAIVGVAKDYGDYVDILESAQAEMGNQAFWRGSTERTGCSVRWAATGEGDVVLVTLDPVPNDLTSTNYVVRYIPTVARPTDATTSVEVPNGADERLVLGLARRAHIKDSGASALINQLIMDADAELAFDASAKLGGVKAKVRKSPLSTPRFRCWPDYTGWRYF